MNTQEFVTTLARYVEVRDGINTLEAERRALAEAIGAHMAQEGRDTLSVAHGGRHYKVRRSASTRVDYDEDLLRKRLGERYLSILAVDARKVKVEAERLREWLGEHLIEVGSPDRARVKEAVEHGLVRVEEFSGAFRRETKSIVTVKDMGPLAESDPVY